MGDPGSVKDLRCPIHAALALFHAKDAGIEQFGGPLAAHGPLRRDLQRWLARARQAGLDDESIEALFASAFRSASEEDIA